MQTTPALQLGCRICHLALGATWTQGGSRQADLPHVEVLPHEGSGQPGGVGAVSLTDSQSTKMPQLFVQVLMNSVIMQHPNMLHGMLLQHALDPLSQNVGPQAIENYFCAHTFGLA